MKGTQIMMSKALGEKGTGGLSHFRAVPPISHYYQYPDGTVGLSPLCRLVRSLNRRQNALGRRPGSFRANKLTFLLPSANSPLG